MFEPANLEELAKAVQSFITPEVVSEAKRSKLNDHLRHKSQAHPSRAFCSGKSPKAVFPVGKTTGSRQKVLSSSSSPCRSSKITSATCFLAPTLTKPRDTRRKRRDTSTAGSKKKAFPSAAEAVADLETRMGKRSASWTYHDAKGQPVGLTIRWDRADGKEYFPVSMIGAGWVQCGMQTPRPLDRLPDLLRSFGPVYVPEGEEAADALHELGFTLMTSAHGATSEKSS